MLDYKKRGAKFVQYWENDFEFRRIARNTKSRYFYEKNFGISINYCDLLFQKI